jgi:hypothetical protein
MFPITINDVTYDDEQALRDAHLRQRQERELAVRTERERLGAALLEVSEVISQRAARHGFGDDYVDLVDDQDWLPTWLRMWEPNLSLENVEVDARVRFRIQAVRSRTDAESATDDVQAARTLLAAFINEVNRLMDARPAEERDSLRVYFTVDEVNRASRRHEPHLPNRAR